MAIHVQHHHGYERAEAPSRVCGLPNCGNRGSAPCFGHRQPEFRAQSEPDPSACMLPSRFHVVSLLAALPEKKMEKNQISHCPEDAFVLIIIIIIILLVS